MRALRVEANPVRARRLLAGYLDRYPNGSLAEEALAMSIEAAVAHGDDDAPVLARRYVRRYPGGPLLGAGAPDARRSGGCRELSPIPRRCAGLPGAGVWRCSADAPPPAPRTSDAGDNGAGGSGAGGATRRGRRDHQAGGATGSGGAIGTGGSSTGAGGSITGAGGSGTGGGAAPAPAAAGSGGSGTGGHAGAAARPEAAATSPARCAIMALGDSTTGSVCWRAMLWTMLNQGGFSGPFQLRRQPQQRSRLQRPRLRHRQRRPPRRAHHQLRQRRRRGGGRHADAAGAAGPEPRRRRAVSLRDQRRLEQRGARDDPGGVHDRARGVARREPESDRARRAADPARADQRAGDLPGLRLPDRAAISAW